MRKGRLKEGDILFMNRGEIGKLALITNAHAGANLNSQIAYLRSYKSEVVNKYLLYYLACSSVSGLLASMKMGSVLTQFPIGDLLEIYVPLPSDTEQQKIANFLDHETAKIDTLIEKQQQLIALLKEKRQAVISHAVTKGLNPSAPMRNSGVEWLGDVPEDWVILSVRSLIRAEFLKTQDGNHGEQHPVAAEYVDAGIPFLMANNVQKGKISKDDCKYISLKRANKLRIGFAKSGDVLLTHKGTVGEVGIIPESIDEPYWMLTPQVTYYRFDHKEYFNKYFYMLFQSKFFQEQLRVIGGKQSTRAYVGLVAQGDLLLVVPPFDEQIQIYTNLERSVDKYEYLISKAESTVTLLNERRTALISAAVTGKIDVRNWQAPEPSDQQNKEVAA